jgi:hypothetical protein
MQPSLVREPFHRPGWVYEEKYDGWRMLAFKDGTWVLLISRQGVEERVEVNRRRRRHAPTSTGAVASCVWTYSAPTAPSR